MAQVSGKTPEERILDGLKERGIMGFVLLVEKGKLPSLPADSEFIRMVIDAYENDRTKRVKEDYPALSQRFCPDIQLVDWPQF